MRVLNNIALILTIIGGINWGSIGLFKFDIVAWICGGQDAIFARIIYAIVGLAAVWCISLLFGKGKKNTVHSFVYGPCFYVGTTYLSGKSPSKYCQRE